MGVLLVQHKVVEFATWKTAFEAHASARAEAGFSGERVLRSLDDPNEVTIWIEYADEAKAKRFSMSEDLRSAMMKAGVLGVPTVRWLREA